MADEWDWGDVGDVIVAVAAVAVAASVEAGIRGLFGGDKQRASQGMYPVKEGIPPTTNLVGDFTRVAGALIMRDAQDQAMVNMQAIHAGRIAEVPPRYWLHDDEVQLAPGGYVDAVIDGPNDGRYTNAGTYIFARTGLPTETKYTDSFLDRFPYYWTDPNWRGDNIATIYLRGIMPSNRREYYPGGIPELSCAARAVCFDWRDVAQDIDDPMSWEACANPVVWTVFKAWREWGVDWDTQIAPVLADLTAEADYCDEPVALKAGGTEPRYRCAGWHYGTDSESSVRSRLLDCMDGWYDFDRFGNLIVKAGRVETDVPIITADMIEGWVWEHGTPTEDAVKEIVIKYQSPDHKYNDVSPDPWVINELASRGETLDVPWVKWLSQSRRLAKRMVPKLNPKSRGTVSMGRVGRTFKGYRYLRIQNPDEPLMADVLCEVMQRDLSSDGGTYTYTLREAEPAVDSWNAATEEGDPVEYVAAAAGEPLAAPEITDADAVQDGTLVRVSIDATGPDRTDLTWFTAWRVGSSGTWVEEASSASGGTVTLLTGSVPQVSNLEVRVMYRTGQESLSPPSDPFDVNSTILSVPEPTNLSATGGVGQVNVSWRYPQQPFAYVKIKRNTTNNYGTATELGTEHTGGLGQTVTVTDTISPGPYWYWVRAFDDDDNPSDPVGPVTASST
ncbi:hypothetical protein [Asticcacaulis endophyticus]|uniref:Fibronectin type-III domain-containing protein n=1 Tax=Asticcacaulis endophyticus TaxID=1395890 RepID=A0A918UN33_9CAUL|nr:hypothetical protein [Asticcacaulis endophyticus]GGZ21675.1 hypothetical protein GCM10011273_03060 [Asticcacaulis endophyticus]